MTSTPPEVPISDSWVDLSGQFSNSASPLRVTPIPFGGEQDYLRMLREAQRESNRASNKVSPISSALMSLSSTTRNTPSQSPKSPPNSPNPELAAFAEDFKDVYVNRVNEHHYNASSSSGGVIPGQTNLTGSDLIWDWNSRPNIPPKEWATATSATNGVNKGRSRKSSTSSRFNGSAKSSSLSSTSNEDKGSKLFSKEVVVTLVLTNLFSLLIGAGIGIFFSKRGNDNLIQVSV